MSPFGTIVLTAAAMAMLSAQVTMQTVNQTKKPRCVSIRPIPQPEPQQPPSRSVSRSLSSPPKSKSATDLKPSSSPSGSKSALAGPRSPVAAGPKTPFSSRSKSRSNGPVPMASASPKTPFSSRSKSRSNGPVPMASASPKTSFSSRSKSRSNGPVPMTSSGSRSPPDSVRSKPSRRKSPNSVQGQSNASSPESRTIPTSDSFSLFKWPLQMISNIFMPPTVKQNTSSVISPIINFQMPLTFSTIHAAAPYQVPCKKITMSPTPCGNPEPRTCTDISPAGPCSKDTQSKNGFLIYNFLCNLFFRKTIICQPPAVTTTTAVPDTETITTSCISTTPFEVTHTETTTIATTETPTESSTAPTVTPTTRNGNRVTVSSPPTDRNDTTCGPDTTITSSSTQTPTTKIEMICKVITCTPVLRYIITKHLVCKSSLLSTCYFNKPAKKQWRFRHPVINHHPNVFHDARNDYATASDDSTLGDKQAELILKLIEILLSSSNH